MPVKGVEVRLLSGAPAFAFGLAERRGGRAVLQSNDEDNGDVRRANLGIGPVFFAVEEGGRGENLS